MAKLQSYHVSQHIARLCIVCIGGGAVYWMINFARLLQADRPITRAGFWVRCFAVVQAVKP